MNPLQYVEDLQPIECGEEAAKHFAFEKGYRNLNHGAYGTYPIEVRSVFRHFQESTEQAPDRFIRFEYRTDRLDHSRAVIARYINAPPETCVYVPNATTAYDTIVRNLAYAPGDVVVCFAEIYTSFEFTLRYLAETTPVAIEKIEYRLPVSDAWLCDAFERTVRSVRARGQNPRLAIFDTINSTPGTRMPFERLTELCRSLGVLSLIDGAHGVGHLPLDMRALDPDFFTSNCHKWLYVPRSCSVLYVPVRNQHLLRTTLPTGFEFVPAAEHGTPKTYPPGKNEFVVNFSSVGTLDDTPYLCVEAGIAWRAKLAWNGKTGEEAALGYMTHLSRRGAERLTSRLGTESIDNEEKTHSRCLFANVKLPLLPADLAPGEAQHHGVRIAAWMLRAMVLDHRIALFVGFYRDFWYVRVSAQVYLTLEDYDVAAEALRAVCERVRRGEWRD